MGTINNLEHVALAPTAIFDVGRFAHADLGLALEPSFRISRADRVLVMGSCFAVRVREALRSIGFDATDAGLDLKYNAFSMLQEVRWSLDGGFVPAYVMRSREGKWLNPHRHPARWMDSRATALDAHVEAQRTAGELLRGGDVLVLTYGLIEAWFDTFTGLYTNETPPLRDSNFSDKRFVLRQTTHAQNLAAILELVRTVRAANPALRIVASVSPVPLKATYCGPDVLVSNCVSKSTLRAALHEAIVQLRSEGVAIDYFPSYELVTLAPRRDDAWHAAFPDGSPDGRHVREDFVERSILPTFLRTYVGAEALAHQPA